MIHLTASDYRTQTWNNGKGTTTELWRLERDGKILVRLSRAAVVEDGPFSLFPGIERNLTVLTGSGFHLIGPGVNLYCAPLVPVAFPGDVEVTATETHGQQSDDFNVMTARDLPRPEVTVVQNVDLAVGGHLALYALGPCRVKDTDLAPNDLCLTQGPVRIRGDGPVVAVRYFGV
jgi:environmental stress-induced protein Ves